MIIRTVKIEFLVFIAFLFLLFSCEEEGDKKQIGQLVSVNANNVELITIDPKYRNDTDYGLIEEIKEITAVKLSNEKLLAEASKVRFSQNYIYVFDKAGQAIFIFNNDGEYVNSIENVGRGPGEFAKITDFTFNTIEDEIVILDNMNRKLIFYDQEGRYKSEDRFSFHARNFDISFNQYVLYNDFNLRLKGANFNVFLADSVGQVLKHLFPFSEERLATNRVKKTYLTRNDATINYVGHYEREWYKFTRDSTWLAYSIDFGNYNAPNEIVDNTFDAFAGYAHGISNFHDNGRHLAFTYRFGDSFKTVYYNKESKTITRALTGIPHIAYYSFVNPVIATRGDSFVQIINAQRYAEIYSEYGALYSDADDLKEGHGEFYNILNSLKEEDNPILVFYTLK